MRQKFFPAGPLLVLVLCASWRAQTSLVTALNGTSGQRGAMFDVVNTATVPITITGFDQHFLGAGGAASIEVWTVASGGSFVPVEHQPQAWTLVASIPWLVTLPQGSLTPLGVTLAVPLAAGAARGFYITTTPLTAAYVAYTVTSPGTTGTTWSSGPSLEILVGAGKIYPFGPSFEPRAWNGRVHFGFQAVPPEFEVNSPSAELVVGGVVGNPYLKALTNACAGSTVSLSIGSTETGRPFEVALSTQPLVPASALAPMTPSGQIVNVAIGPTSPVFLSTGTSVAATMTFPGPVTVGLVMPPGPLTFSVQALHYAPSHADGFSLSQGCEARIANGVGPGSPLPGPTGDDTTVEAPVGCFPLFGGVTTTISVSSNGRILFGGSNPSPFPGVQSALTDLPSVGAWTDLAPNAGGLVSIATPAIGVLRVHWQQVPYYSFPSLTVDFAIELDLATGGILLDGLGSFAPYPVPPQPATNAQWIGISAGHLGATDPGPRSFQAGTSGPAPSGLGAVYRFGQAGTLVPGVSRIAFVPSGGNYSWAAF